MKSWTSLKEPTKNTSLIKKKLSNEKAFVYRYTFSLSQITFAQKKTYSIGVLLETQNKEITFQLKQLQNQVQTVVGEDAEIIFSDKYTLINNYNIDTAKQQYQELVASPVDIILAFGIINSNILMKEKVFQKPTILLGAFNQDFNTIDFSRKKSNINNFTYLIELNLIKTI